MSSGKSNQPKIVSRKGKGSVVSTTYEFPLKPAERSLGQMLYDSQAGTLMGRSGKSWAQLLLFYTLFYIVLAALFAICMKGLMMTIDDWQPKWQLEESLIGTNPGLGFRPSSHDVDQGSLIWYDSSNQSDISYWANRIDEFLEEYTHTAANQKNCDFDTLPNKGQVCKLDIASFGACTAEHAYGYNNSAPCFFLKLNRIYNWVPEYYNDPLNLPDDMPQDLIDHITSLPASHRNQVWVSCRGENGADREIIGDIEYYPTRGFPSYFYPYTNVANYLSPLVSVKFTRPGPNQIINIECRAWAKNIKYVGSFRDRQGSVHFELMIDAPTK
jgi:sodium/potassium-transporting ATPase subunit beta